MKGFLANILVAFVVALSPTQGECTDALIEIEQELDEFEKELDGRETTVRDAKAQQEQRENEAKKHLNDLSQNVLPVLRQGHIIARQAAQIARGLSQLRADEKALMHNFGLATAPIDSSFRAIQAYIEMLDGSECDPNAIGAFQGLVADVDAGLVLETKFLYAIENLSHSCDRLRENLSALGRSVVQNSDFSGLRNIAREALQGQANRLVGMRQAYIELQHQRRGLLKAIYGMVLIQASAIPIETTLGRAGELTGQIRSTVIFMDLRDEIREFLKTLARNGSADGFNTKYLLYELPLRLLRLRQGTLREYIRRIEEFTAIPEETREQLQAELESALSKINREVGQLEAKGWDGQFAKQQLRMEAYRKIALQLSLACRNAIAEFDQTASGGMTQDLFPLAEEAFRNVVDLCVKEKAQ